MIDKEKVIKAVETCFDSWIDRHRNMGLDLQAVEQMKRDALELLKEQEPVHLIAYYDKADGTWHCGCGNCYKQIDNDDKYCRHCGRKVK